MAQHADVLLTTNSRVGNYSVMSINDSSLTMRGHRGAAVSFCLIGLLMAVWGVLPWWAMLFNSGHPVSGRALSIAPLGILLIVGGVFQFASRLVVSGTDRAVIETGLGGKSKRTDASQLSDVYINVLPTNLQQRETIVVKVRSAVGEKHDIVIGMERTNKNSTTSLVLGAIAIAQLLHLRMVFTGECREGNQDLKNALATAMSR